MLDIIYDTLIDGIKLIPFLFVAFLLIELLEHKMNKKTTKAITNAGKVGPLVGGILGMFPQCGFSVMATNLYVTRIVTLGTLIAIYLSTSDEMLPILLSQKVDVWIILKILAIKFFIGITVGFIIDFITRKAKDSEKTTYEICEDEHCHCENGILKSAIKHTAKTLLFIMLVSLLLSSLIEFIGEENLSKVFLKNSIFGPFIASLIGLIPNCASSIMLTQLYLENAISFSSVIAGLLTGSGVAILVLLKSNKNLKENLMILGIIYGVGVASGIVIELIGMMF